LFENGLEVFVSIDKEVGLPMLSCSINSSRKGLEVCLCGSIMSDRNKNLSTLQRELLRWHYCLGHINFQNLQWIGRQGILGELGYKWGSTTVKAPICEPCQYGKQARTPKQGSTSKREKKGVFYKEKLNPGDLVFSDQFESSMGGRYYNEQGRMNTHHEYKGGTSLL
jgi:hypothetical protein